MISNYERGCFYFKPVYLRLENWACAQPTRGEGLDKCIQNKKTTDAFLFVGFPGNLFWEQSMNILMLYLGRSEASVPVV